MSFQYDKTKIWAPRYQSTQNIRDSKLSKKKKKKKKEHNWPAAIEDLEVELVDLQLSLHR